VNLIKTIIHASTYSDTGVVRTVKQAGQLLFPISLRSSQGAVAALILVSGAFGVKEKLILQLESALHFIKVSCLSTS
jgi:hypothetical protein